MQPHRLVSLLGLPDVLLQPAVLLLQGVQALPGCLPQSCHLADQTAEGHTHLPHGLHLKGEEAEWQ